MYEGYRSTDTYLFTGRRKKEYPLDSLTKKELKQLCEEGYDVSYRTLVVFHGDTLPLEAAAKVATRKRQDVEKVAYVIVLGPSCAGKNYVIDWLTQGDKELFQNYTHLQSDDVNVPREEGRVLSGLERLCSVTTRKARRKECGEFEKDGVDYYFLEDCKSLKQNKLGIDLSWLDYLETPHHKYEILFERGCCLEINRFASNYYGLCKLDIMERLFKAKESDQRPIFIQDAGNGGYDQIRSRIMRKAFLLEGYDMVPIPVFISPVENILDNAEVEAYVEKVHPVEMRMKRPSITHQELRERLNATRKELQYPCRFPQEFRSSIVINNARRLDSQGNVVYKDPRVGEKVKEKLIKHPLIDSRISR